MQFWNRCAHDPLQQEQPLTTRQDCAADWPACRSSGAPGALLQAAAEGTSSAEVVCERCDTSSQEEAAALLAQYSRRKGCKGIAGLLLAGGVLSDAVFSSQTAGLFPS